MNLRWPDDKLEQDMLADCERVESRSYSLPKTPQAKVCEHVKALLDRVRALEQDRDVLADQLKVACERAEAWKALLVPIAAYDGKEDAPSMAKIEDWVYKAAKAPRDGP